MERRLVGTNILVNDFLKNLEEVEVLDDDWSIKYVDKISGKEWLKYCFDDRGFRFDLIQITPPLNTENLITIAVNSTYEDEAVAAANRLYFEEINFKGDYRTVLIDRIEKTATESLNDAEKVKIEKVIKASQLTDSTNRRDIIGKSYKEVYADADYYKNIADKANKILLKIRERNYLLP